MLQSFIFCETRALNTDGMTEEFVSLSTFGVYACLNGAAGLNDPVYRRNINGIKCLVGPLELFQTRVVSASHVQVNRLYPTWYPT